MESLTDFQQQYKNISNSDLLYILINPQDYQPLSIKAAQQEFNDRQLSDKEIQDAKEILQEIRIIKEKQSQKIKLIENKINTARNTFFDTINPIQTGIPAIEKTIRLILIVFSALFVYGVVHDYRTLIFSVKDFPRWPLSNSLIILPIVILPLGIFGFWKKQRFGWFLLAIFVTFSIVGALWILLQPVTWFGSRIFFSRPSPFTYIIVLLFFLGTLYVICKKDMREIFSISKKKMEKTIAITAVISLLWIMAGS
jgi:hypothetical protein